jgi:hypothetical protein
MEDASLDDFLDADGNSESDSEDSGPSDADGSRPGYANESTGTGNRATDPTGPEPATPTLEWSPAEAECESCGTEVRRRWNSGRGLVCSDCKEW